MVDKKRGAKARCDGAQKAREVVAQRRAAEAEAKAQALAAEADAKAHADAGAYEAQLHQLQADLQQREQQVADTQRLQHLQQLLQDLQQDELQRKEQQVAEQQQQLQQQQEDMHLRELQFAEQQHQVRQREQQVAQQQHQLQQQQADMQQREQQVAQQQHQLQQQQADMQQREQQVAQQQHQLQQQQADMQQREQQGHSQWVKRITAAHKQVGSTTFEMLRPPWVKRITAAHKQVCVCIPCETCELLLDQLGKHMDSLVVPEDPRPPDDSDSDSESDSDTNSDGGDAEVHVVLAEHIANADAQDLAGVLDAGVLDEGGLEKLVSDAQNARAIAGVAGRGVAIAGGTAGGADVRVDLDYATVQSWFVCPCKVGAKPSLTCLQRQCAACKDRKVGVKAEREGVQLQYRQFKKLDNGQGVELATVQTTLGELVVGLNDLMQKQLWHHYLAKHQRATFRAHCAAVRNTPGLVVVSCDWSEKLTIHQDIACQGAYWKQRTMSVFVACAHYQDMAGNYREESVFVSADKCDQSAEASTTALVQVIECLLQGRRHPDDGWVGKMDMRQLCLWSDGCASQFKGAKAIRLHWHLANRFGVPVQWSYGATSHFKSTHDSEGGVIKREWREQMLVHPELVGKVCGAAVLTDWANKHFAVPCHAQDTSASHRLRGHIMFRRYLVLDDARQAAVCSMPEADVERMHNDVKGCRAMHRMVFTPDREQPQWAMAACACNTCMSVPCQPCMKPDTTTPLEPMPMFQDTVKEVRADEECYALLMLYHPDLLHDEDLQQDELQRKEQQVAEQQQQLQQQQADMHLREQQLAEQQHQLQQQQADMQQREQQVAQQQQQVQQQQADLQLREQQVAQQHHQVQQQQADLQLREQQVATQKHQVQQQQADLQLREQQVAQQHHQVQLQQQLDRLQQQLEAQSGAELQRQVQQQLAAQQHLLQQQQADLLLKQQQVEKQPQEAAVQQAVSTHHPLPDHSTCSPQVPGSLRSPLFMRPRQDTTLAPMPRLPDNAQSVMENSVTVTGRLVTVGASGTIISQERLERHEGNVNPAALQRKIMMEPLRVLTATNQPVVITERRCGLLEVQKSKTNCNAVVMRCRVDARALLKVKHRVCTLFEALGESGKPVNLFALQPKHLPGFATVAAMKEQWESAAEIKLLSPGQAVRQLRKGCSSWLMLVKPGDAGDQQGWHQGSLAAVVAGCSEQNTKAEQDPELVPQAVLEGLLSEYADVFGDMPPGLPPDRPVGHTIRTPPGSEAPYKRMYKLSPREEAEVKKQVAELLAKGLIEPSSSPYGAPILFVQKKDGSLRMCIDYRALNKLTVRDRYPLPRIDDLFDKLAGKRVFSSLDLQSGYHQIRITEEDVPKTAFLTPMGQFQFKVLCFGLTNAPATFQRMMNNVFKPLINECVLVYIDDILVMSNTPEEHVQHLRQVLQLMRENKFYAKLARCEFNKTQLAFLGHIVGSNGIAVDPAKVQVVKEWPTPRNLKDLQAFLGLANYFRRFIPNFSSLAAPLTNLTSKQVAAAYDWEHFGGSELEAFDGLKEALCSAPVLALPDFSKPFVVCTDASLVGTGGVLMQYGRPIAYTSKKMSPAETRYATGEQELLGIIRAVREWRCYLDGAVDVTILTDHNPLIYLQTQPNLSRRQVRWKRMEELSRYKYEIKYIPGATNVADPISRNPALAKEVALTCSSSPHNADSEDAMTVIMTLSSRAEGLIYAITTRRTAARLRESAELGQVAAREAAQRAGQLAPPDDLAAAHTPGQARMTSAHQKGAQPGGGEALRQQQQTTESQNKSNKQGGDEQSTTESGLLTLMQAIKQAYAADTRFADEAFTSQLYQHEGLWLTEWGRVVVPDDAALRNTPCMTPGPLVTWNVKSYVRSCHSCQVNKSSAKKPAGLLQPLPIPERPWDSVSMDLIVKLPASGPNKYDSILVFVDRLTKMVHLVKTWESMTATQYAKLFLENVFRLHGMPRSVVSDRGPQFHNKFWAEVTKLLQVQVNLSSAYHPETDGQTERVNRVIEEMLRHFIRPDQRDWAEYLPLVEFAINNAWQESVRSTPFYLNYGYHPRLAELLDLPQKVPQAHDFVKGMKRAVEQARQCLARAQKRMKSYQDNKRRDALYLPGDMVLLSTQNMRGKANQPGVRKLKPRYVGPFNVQYMVGKAAVKLWLPDEWSRLHNVFHVSLVKPYRTDASEAVPGLAGPPPVQWLDGEPQYTVEKVVGHRLEPSKGKRKGKSKKRRLEFLVKWQGHGDEHNTWELSTQLVGCQELMARYMAEHNLGAEAEEAA
ncbi:hypothetical protein QJQ45_024663, partial [Haematococcus lacustris]